VIDDGKRRGLGRGLSALLGEDSAAPARATTSVPIELLHPGRYQPRRRFDEESMKALVESVEAQGILQPLLVRRHPSMPEAYEILAGERRWRAAQRARLHEVPVLVRELDDRAAMEIALVENIQRDDLQPLEEAGGYQRLIAEFAYTQEALAQRVGKSRSHIANMMRLLGLPEEVKSMIEDGRLTAGHARALLTARDPVAMAKEAVAGDWSVRQTERAAQASHNVPKSPAASDDVSWRNKAEIAKLQQELSTVLGLKVTLQPDGETSGSLTIRYRTLDQFDAVMTMLKAPHGR
jgi:ParB family transcriptional regulator, chromosome partitioning protein